MLETIVIDADVFMHSENPLAPKREDAKRLLSKLLEGTVYLCVDDGFDLDEAKNRSAIGHEYLVRVRQVSAAFAVIVTLGINGRILRLGRQVDQNVGRVICRFVPDKSDRIYVKISYNSTSKALVSHDNAAYSSPTKATLRHKLDVRVMDACLANLEL